MPTDAKNRPAPDPGRPIPCDEAVDHILHAVRPLPCEVVPLERALGAYLAEPARARAHSPRFEQSAMDGWAVRAADLADASPGRPMRLRIAGEMPAGCARRQLLKAGATIRVFTGSPLPGGTGAVVVQEQAARDGDAVVFTRPVADGAHVRRVGEEYRRGDVLLPAGTAVTPPVIGLLAQIGRAAVKIGGRPTVLVVTMGDELVAPGTRPGRAQVVDANGPALCAALRAMGAGGVRHVRVPDDAGALRRALAQGLRGADLVVTVGGASVGDHDHVPTVRAQLGIVERFGRVAMRPGLPNWFGLSAGGVPVFGLPGNPVSALVSCEVLVRPAVLRLMGAAACRHGDGESAVLAAPTAPAPDRVTFLRARLERGGSAGGAMIAVPESGQGSHMLGALARAGALAEVPAGPGPLPAGTAVTVHRLGWFDR